MPNTEEIPCSYIQRCSVVAVEGTLVACFAKCSQSAAAEGLGAFGNVIPGSTEISGISMNFGKIFTL